MATCPSTTCLSWTGSARCRGCAPLKVSAADSRPRAEPRGSTATETPAQRLDPGRTTLWRRPWVRERPSGKTCQMLGSEDRWIVSSPPLLAVQASTSWPTLTLTSFPLVKPQSSSRLFALEMPRQSVSISGITWEERVLVRHRDVQTHH